MSDILKSIIGTLSHGIPAWIRGAIITLSVILTFMYFSGFTYENYVIAQEVALMKHESILMSYRSSLDENKFADRIVNEVHNNTNSYGVALFGLEPEYIPKVIRCISREGEKDFNAAIRVGMRIHINSRLPNAYMQLREGLSHQENLHDGCRLKAVGVKSAIAHPIVYRGLTVGTLAIFLDKELGEYSQADLSELNGEVRMACAAIAEELYYNREKEK